MKIAVSSVGKDLEAGVDLGFGRAKGFVIIDTESGETVHMQNFQNLNAVQGAGIRSAEKVISMGVEVVLTGHCGPKAFATLRAAGVTLYLVIRGTVRDAIGKFNRGELSKAKSADVMAHW